MSSSSAQQPPTTSKPVVPNANDLQSKLAKLQQNIAQKLNKTGIVTTTAQPPPTTTTPKQLQQPNNNTTTTTTTPTQPTSTTTITPSSSVVPLSSTIKKPSSSLIPNQLSKIQKPNHHHVKSTTAPTPTIGVQVATQIQKSLQSTTTPITKISTQPTTKTIPKPKTIPRPSSLSTITTTPTTTTTTVLSEEQTINTTSNNTNTIEKQIYMKDYQKKQESSQLAQQYQKELHDHELAQQQLLNDEEESNKKKKKNLRTVYTSSGKSEVWEDSRLDEFIDNDYRIHANNLGNEITDQMLSNYFSTLYKSFSKAVVIRDKRTNRSKGYGFISFLDSNDYVHALENLNGKYLGNRPLQLKPSKWKDRNVNK